MPTPSEANSTICGATANAPDISAGQGRIRAWWRRHKVNSAHAQALRWYCVADGHPHEWDWDYESERKRQDAERAKFGGTLQHNWPAWVTPCGDVQACTRCGDRRLINEPSR